MQLFELLAYLDEILEVDKFRDYCPNGLQVEGKAEVTKLVAGVTASQALLDYAVETKADAVLVHHGYFWKGEAVAISGMKRQRLKTLLQHDINLIAYHLPLDAHPQFGNNAQLAKLLGFEITGSFGPEVPAIGMKGQLPETVSLKQLCSTVGEKLGREILAVDAGPENIKNLAWCTGAAQSMIESAALAGVDAFISGEISEPTAHVAREYGLHYLACGHHATERYGVMALAAHLEQQFGLQVEFVDIDNPA